MSSEVTDIRDDVLREKYVRNFDPEAYLGDLLTYHYKWVKLSLDYLHEVFAAGSVRGSELLDLGCGPTAHCVLSASRCFERITLADVSSRSLDSLRGLLQGEVHTAHWNRVLEHVARLEGFQDTAEGAADISQRTRRAVRRLVQCDVLRDPLLSCTQTHTFDCIVSSLCLEAAATDMDSYSEALLRVVRHLRPGGTFVMMGVLGCDSYTAGGVEFPCLHLTMDKVAECVERAKLTDCCWTFVNKWPSIEDDVNGNGWTGAFMLKAERR